ncbi:MAG: type II toxin-antitoxin system Phd/YefM family antitoxin [Acidobacteria bacterium]|jgi:prevent-host-death family protein|nr:type II toxin-antitoxin system Phd/YefM family antitoxin [Acidobacteriota bacterium]MBA3785270.1 type II toxin-antitoxin system Phd/YefM family antitoxin [Acidobacteriota bacterium]MBA4124545.1 type II toxin-antitoxin system Phd/YefM family antitoxin [Acidobacteriota bacterium]MBA4185078.1 type II toxin-antitoxin system Phd/YefM family antitoxin [Acidobacteriota bacterium]
MFETITAAEAKNEIQNLIDETAASHRPILITAERHNAILLSEEDWNALQETLHLLSIPTMRESIVAEMNAPDEDFLSEDEFLAGLETGKDKQN